MIQIKHTHVVFCFDGTICPLNYSFPFHDLFALFHCSSSTKFAKLADVFCLACFCNDVNNKFSQLEIPSGINSVVLRKIHTHPMEGVGGFKSPSFYRNV